MTEPTSVHPQSRSAGIAAQVAGWLTIVIGLLHLFVGVATSTRWNLRLLWFEGSGIAVILIGTITILVRRRAGDRVFAWVVLGANCLGIALGVVFCLITEWREPQGIALIVLFAAAAVACLALRTGEPVVAD